MNFSLSFPIHNIPPWFLILSLFLPRISMIVAWMYHTMPQFIPNPVAILPAIVALIVPRIFILCWIYMDQGITIWFLLHLIALLVAWGGGGHRVSRRRRRDDLID